MTAKEYLSQYRKLKFDAMRYEADYRELMSLLDIASVDYTAIKVQTPHTDHMADIIAEANGRLEALKTILTRVYRMREDILRLIDILPEGRYKCVMTERYINGMTFDEIADTIGRTRRTAERIHGEALRILDDSTQMRKVNKMQISL